MKVIKSSQCKPDLYLLPHRKYANKQDANKGFKKCFVGCGFSVSVNGRCWCIVVWGLVYGKCVPPDIGNEVFYWKCVLGSYLSIAAC